MTTYAAMDRFLHRAMLGPRFVRQFTFDMELMFAGVTSAQLKERSRDPVYVTGLARSGTTLILRVLSELDDFVSLTYRDMPFILAPNLHAKFNTNTTRNVSATERPHGDGLIVTLDSPESFEEVFWRSFEADFTSARHIPSHAVSADTLQQFAKFRAVVVSSRLKTSRSNTTQRYLSKNNNNITRIDSLLTEADATALMIFRNPIETAHSLFTQHQNFTNLSESDSFVAEYMAWLNHFEFGPNHKPFDFVAAQMDPSLLPAQADYWLEYWIAFHKHLLALLDRKLNISLINHDQFIARPKASMAQLYAAVKAAPPGRDQSVMIKQKAPDAERTQSFNPTRVKAAQLIYDQLAVARQNIIAVSPS